MRRLALFAVLAAALSLATWTALPRAQGAAASRTTVVDLLSYEKQLVPVVTEGGELVEQSMKPALRDLRYDHVTPPSFMATEAEQWTIRLASVRARVMAIKTVPELSAVSRAIADAIDGYGEAARYFRSAFVAEAGPARDQLVSQGITSARAADQRYDRASAGLQSIRHRLGLPANPNFPGGAHG